MAMVHGNRHNIQNSVHVISTHASIVGEPAMEPDIPKPTSGITSPQGAACLAWQLKEPHPDCNMHSTRTPRAPYSLGHHPV